MLNLRIAAFLLITLSLFSKAEVFGRNPERTDRVPVLNQVSVRQKSPPPQRERVSPQRLASSPSKPVRTPPTATRPTRNPLQRVVTPLTNVRPQRVVTPLTNVRPQRAVTPLVRTPQRAPTPTQRVALPLTRVRTPQRAVTPLMLRTPQRIVAPSNPAPIVRRQPQRPLPPSSPIRLGRTPPQSNQAHVTQDKTPIRTQATHLPPLQSQRPVAAPLRQSAPVSQRPIHKPQPHLLPLSPQPPSPQPIVTANQRPIHILSLDGGGVRGLGTARILWGIQDEVQRRLGRPISIFDMFDVYAGSSTGGLISLMLTTGRPIDECIQLYKTQASRIFTRSWTHMGTSLLGLRKPKYDETQGLCPLLKEKFGETLLRDARKPTLVTTFEPARTKLWLLDSERAKNPKSRFHSLRMREAGRATSAAPTYFSALNLKYPTTVIDGKQIVKNPPSITVVDGGVAANNPSQQALHRAQKLFPNRRYVLVSVGTGHEHPAPTERRAGLYHVAPTIIHNLMGGTTAATHEAVKSALGKTYYRIQFSSNLGLDATHPNQLQNLEDTAAAVRNTPAFQGVVDALCTNLR
jgi:hypothetical protein